MSIEIASFVFGGILLFVGLLGGGFEVKELKVPTVSSAVRIVAGILGLVFILVGLGAHSDGSSEPAGSKEKEPLQADVPPEDPVEFTLLDSLGDGEISEQVNLLIDGKEVGNLTVSEDYPQSKIRVTVPYSGQHSYTAESTSVFTGPQGPIRYSGAGQGIIDVEPGKTYSLRASVSGSTFLISVVEEQ